MKLIIGVQKVLIVATFIVGLLFMISEAPITAGIGEQATITLGGAVVILLSFGWGWLVSREEGYITHEAR